MLAKLVVAESLTTGIPRIFKQAQKPLSHTGLERDNAVVIGVGRCGRAKIFSLQFRIFVRITQAYTCRSATRTDRKKNENLKLLCESHGTADMIDVSRFYANLYAFVARAKLFALISRREGLLNALVEVPLLGVQVVATDCDSDSAEILQYCKQEPIVPACDVEHLAITMIEVLGINPGVGSLQRALRGYGYRSSARHYRQAFGMPVSGEMPAQ